MWLFPNNLEWHGSQSFRNPIVSHFVISVRVDKNDHVFKNKIKHEHQSDYSHLDNITHLALNDFWDKGGSWFTMYKLRITHFTISRNTPLVSLATQTSVPEQSN